MCIPVHSPWEAGYINVTQTILVIVTMVLFQTDLIARYRGWEHNPEAKVQMPTLPLTTYVPLGTSLSLPLPQLPLLENGGSSSGKDIN